MDLPVAVRPSTWAGFEYQLRDLIDEISMPRGWTAKIVTTGSHAATSKSNICNKGRRGAEVQLEITKGLRDDFASQGARSRKSPTLPTPLPTLLRMSPTDVRGKADMTFAEDPLWRRVAIGGQSGHDLLRCICCLRPKADISALNSNRPSRAQLLGPCLTPD